MTTIAWDGTTIAGDTLATDHWGLKSFCSKIETGKDFVMGGAGSRAAIVKWWRKVEQKSLAEVIEYGYPDYDKEKDDPSILLVENTGEVWRHSDGIFLKASRGWAAIGSGRDYALAAMFCGRNSREAVGCAAFFDVNTGGDIQTIQVLPKIDRWPS